MKSFFMSIRIAASLTSLVVSFSALANPDLIKKEIEKNFPEIKVDKITKTAYDGLYEIFAGNELLYTDKKASFFLLGNLIDTKTRENVSEVRLQKLTAIRFDDLPLDMAFKTVRGNGSRRMAVFSDPNCGYCKRFETDLLELKDVTIYTFLYPILAPDSMPKSRQVWCSEDRTKAWQDLMIRGMLPGSDGKCDAPIEKIVELGNRLRINSTPATVFENGERVPGALPKAMLEAKLAAVSANSTNTEAKKATTN